MQILNRLKTATVEKCTCFWWSVGIDDDGSSILPLTTSLMRPEIAAKADPDGEVVDALRACEVKVLDVDSMTLLSSFIKPLLVPVCFEEEEALFSPSPSAD